MIENPEHALNCLRTLNRKLAMAAGFILLGCAAFVIVDIVLRQMKASFGGTEEIAGYVMAITTSWGMGFTLLELGHVRIDLVRSRASTRGRVIFDLFAILVLAITISIVAVMSWPVLERSLLNDSHANTVLETPLAWVQAPWFLGWVWFALTAWLTFVLAIMLIQKGDIKTAESAIGAFDEIDTLT